MTSTSFSYPVYQLMRKQNHELADLFAFKNLGRVNVTVNGEAEVVQADVVSGNFYQQIEVQPQLGRAIGPADDDKPGGSPVAVISDGYWTRRFNRSPDVIGNTILVNLVNVTVIGVNPRGFTGAKGTQETPEIFMPFNMQPLVNPYRTESSLLTSDKVWWMQIMARAKPGVDEARAQAGLDVALKSAVRATMTVGRDESIPNLVLTDGSRGLNQAGRQMAKPLYVLMALVGLVVLLACANMANLLLARSSARQREMSVRMALGAGRARILRQVMTESLLLAVLGGLAGLLVGYFGRIGILAMLSSATEPMVQQGGFDWGVFGFNAALSVVTGILFGLGPAWQATRTQVNSTLKDTALTTTKRRKGFAGRAIVGFQVALSTLLVVVAGVFLRTVIIWAGSIQGSIRRTLCCLKCGRRYRSMRGRRRSHCSGRSRSGWQRCQACGRWRRPALRRSRTVTTAAISHRWARRWLREKKKALSTPLWAIAISGRSGFRW